MVRQRSRVLNMAGTQSLPAPESTANWLGRAVGAELPGHHDPGGGFKWSWQHLALEVLNEESSDTLRGSSGNSRPDMVTRPALDSATRGPGAVLGSDRLGSLQRGGGTRGWGIAGCWSKMVPAGWRDAESRLEAVVGAPIYRWLSGKKSPSCMLRRWGSVRSLVAWGVHHRPSRESCAATHRLGVAP